MGEHFQGGDKNWVELYLTLWSEIKWQVEIGWMIFKFGDKEWVHDQS